MTTATVYIKSESRCVQCDMTIREFSKHAAPELTIVPGIDTPQMSETLLDFKSRLNISAAPVVIIRDAEGNEVDSWGGFRPDKIQQFARQAEAA